MESPAPRCYALARQILGVAGDFTPVLAKHSKSFNLIDTLAVGVDRVQRDFEPMQRQVELCRQAQTSDKQAKLVLYAEWEYAAEQRKHIFQPFFSTKGEKGNGLGLWISHGIVQKHGGSIRVCSSTRQGRTGTSFSVFLPDEGPLNCLATVA